MDSVTGNRLFDKLIFFLLLAALLAVAPGMRVYHEGIPCEVKLVAVGSNGERVDLAVPEALQGVHKSITRLERQIEAYVATAEGTALVESHQKLEWQLICSDQDNQPFLSRTLLTPPTDE